ncbi:MAG: isoprenyl transferase [Alphaproteobacteria bacterium]|nr:isoprenyl transferase [Alphaproteobacteria bacterium]
MSTTESTPTHVAIVMDGNGRWARARGLPRAAGHRQGAEALRRTIVGAGELGIRYLTLFGFSSENWNRPSGEVQDLMGLLRHYLRSEIADLHAKGARLRVIGDRGRFDPDIVALIANAEDLTRGNDRLNLTLAISYGGRDEIITAVRTLSADAAAGRIDPQAIDASAFADRLFTADLPDPDVVIRTSGEKRLSNFLLWQSAYAELVFVDKYWPDFGKADLEDAVHEFKRRERRYGAVG